MTGAADPEFIPENNCPSCGHYLDSAALLSGEKVPPVPGDLTICLYCQSALEFNPMLKLQLLDETTLSSLEKAFINELRLAIKAVGLPPTARQSNN